MALPIESASADRLILSAGTFGSTFLMLKNLPGVSPMLGNRFSGNGDLLTLAMDASVKRGGRRVPLRIEAEPRPIDRGGDPLPRMGQPAAASTWRTWVTRAFSTG